MNQKPPDKLQAMRLEDFRADCESGLEMLRERHGGAYFVNHGSMDGLALASRPGKRESSTPARRTPRAPCRSRRTSYFR